MRIWAIGVVLAATFGLSGLTQAATPRAAPTCGALTAQALPHATVTAAADAPAGQLTACKIEVTAKPRSDSDIRIEIWIPEGAAWNGRYVQFGNGGFAGQISSKRLEAAAALGYAVAMTDDGHESLDRTDARWAVGHPQKVIDFGWRASKETTDAAKALIRVYESEAPKYAYFQGCSDGGREALMEAQRFPDDFDGIVAGAPAYNLSGLLTMAVNDVQALAQTQGSLDDDALKTLEAGALATCGGDKYLTDPATCRFDPASLACPRGLWLTGCLTPGEIASARTIYIGLRDSKTTYPGNTPGAEAEPGAWATWITGPSPDQLDQALIFKFATGFWGGFVFGDANFDIMRLNVAGVHRAVAPVASTVDATDPDLSRFRKHGGKLIQYHGWNDPAIPAKGSIVYFENVGAKLHDVEGFYRLYMIPGMLHCGGGPGPSNVDWLMTLRDWVEKSDAPEGLVATAGLPGQPTAPGAPTQRLCPYPKLPADGDRCV
jgi:hypothetical protein